MSELRGLHQRLEAALGRLDSAIETRLNSAQSQQRIDALMQQLEQTNAENTKLRESTDVVARRLDDAIDRIRRILGE